MKDIFNEAEIKAAIECADQVQEAEKRLEQIHKDVSALNHLEVTLNDLATKISNICGKQDMLNKSVENANKKLLPEEDCERLDKRLHNFVQTFIAAVDTHENKAIEKLSTRISEMERKTTKYERKMDSLDEHATIPKPLCYCVFMSFVILVIFLIAVSFLNSYVVQSSHFAYCIISAFVLLALTNGGYIYYRIHKKERHYY